MNQQTFEQHLEIALKKFGCEYVIAVDDVMSEFAELDASEQAADLDPEDLALAIVNNFNEAGFMELVHAAVNSAVTDMLTQKTSASLGHKHKREDLHV